jgi:hypothetical protein
MSFQSTIRYDFAFGIPGEIVKDGPQRSRPGFLLSGNAANNIIGATAFTQSPSGGGVVAGGTGVFAGLLCNPKVYPGFGTVAGGPLAPTMVLPNNMTAEFLFMGYMVAVLATASVKIGDGLMFLQSTGALSSYAKTASFTGVQAAGVLTVSAITGGTLGVGSNVYAAGVLIGEIISLGTGTGGNGTYNLNTSATVASGPMTADSVAPSGSTIIASAYVDELPQPTAGGLSLIRITQ